MRLRQVALAAHDLEAAKRDLEAKGLRAPFRDPGVKEFGLDNTVLCRSARLCRRSAIKTDVPPDWVRRDACRRSSARPGAVRRQSSWRTAAKLRRPQRTASHLHPRDLAAITSVDQPVDPASWRWGGPGWEERAVPGRVDAVEVVRADPDIWSRLFDRPVVDDVLTFDDGTAIRFVADGPIGVGAVDITIDGTPVRIG